ncbi:MAG: low molecular weight phosphotyrosine protein phosphatase [Gammaproteobacteria bacterium]|nr:low molecular weight phosphotyrosine protein phosphatase [Gammaproteobacteria bacterium]
MNTEKRVKVLFVCMGNICRSPSAEGVFAKLVVDAGLEQNIGVDSAGTHAHHTGEPPDQRSQRCAEKRGVRLDDLKARRVGTEDFERFDYVLAMDRDNLSGLEKLCPPGSPTLPHLFLSYAPGLENDEVPDPYYGGAMGFERVLDMIEEASRGLLQDIQLRYL